MSFAKYPHVEFAGPDGGDGGNGGHVIFIGKTNNILCCKEAYLRQTSAILHFSFCRREQSKLSPMANEDGSEAMRFLWLHKLKEKNNCYLNFHFFLICIFYYMNYSFKCILKCNVMSMICLNFFSIKHEKILEQIGIYCQGNQRNRWKFKELSWSNYDPHIYPSKNPYIIYE